MTKERIIARQHSAPERRPLSPSTLSRVHQSTEGAHPAQRLQRRLGNQGVAAFVARSALQVSSPLDPAEREATAKAAQVMRAPAPIATVVATTAGIERSASGPAILRATAGPQTASPGLSSELQGSMSGGAPLPAGVRSFMEPRFNADFGQVRIHTGDHAAQLSERLNANAFTVGQHLFFGKDQYRPETPAGKELIAHELTHTIQQGASVQRSGGELTIQREEKKSWWGELIDFADNAGWTLIREVAPTLEPLLKSPEGILGWLKERASSAVEGIFHQLTAPVRAISGIGQNLAAHFAPLLATLKTAGGKLRETIARRCERPPKRSKKQLSESLRRSWRSFNPSS